MVCNGRLSHNLGPRKVKAWSPLDLKWDHGKTKKKGIWGSYGLWWSFRGQVKSQVFELRSKSSLKSLSWGPSQVSSLWPQVQVRFLAVMSVLSSAACHPVCLEHGIATSNESKHVLNYDHHGTMYCIITLSTVLSWLMYGTMYCIIMTFITIQYQHRFVWFWYMITWNSAV